MVESGLVGCLVRHDGEQERLLLLLQTLLVADRSPAAPAAVAAVLRSRGARNRLSVDVLVQHACSPSASVM